MRKTVSILILAAAMLSGLALARPAAAGDVRVYVDLGDIVFASGRPYHRHSREPLYVEYWYGAPRYYRVAGPYYPPPRHVRHYAPPGHYVRHYGPPPKRWHKRHRHHDHDYYRDYRGSGEVVIRYRY